MDELNFEGLDDLLPQDPKQIPVLNLDGLDKLLPSGKPKLLKKKSPNMFDAFQPENSAWNLSGLSAVEDFFKQTFGVNLPLSNKGQSAIHNSWGLDHRNSADVGIDPTSPQGQKLIAYLKENNIPYLAFTGPIPGVSTDKHIHIGMGSKRTGEKFDVGTTLSKEIPTLNLEGLDNLVPTETQQQQPKKENELNLEGLDQTIDPSLAVDPSKVDFKRQDNKNYSYAAVAAAGWTRYNKPLIVGKNPDELGAPIIVPYTFTPSAKQTTPNLNTITDIWLNAWNPKYKQLNDIYRKASGGLNIVDLGNPGNLVSVGGNQYKIQARPDRQTQAEFEAFSHNYYEAKRNGADELTAVNEGTKGILATKNLARQQRNDIIKQWNDQVDALKAEQNNHPWLKDLITLMPAAAALHGLTTTGNPLEDYAKNPAYQQEALANINLANNLRYLGQSLYVGTRYGYDSQEYLDLINAEKTNRGILETSEKSIPEAQGYINKTERGVLTGGVALPRFMIAGGIGGSYSLPVMVYLENLHKGNIDAAREALPMAIMAGGMHGFGEFLSAPTKTVTRDWTYAKDLPKFEEESFAKLGIKPDSKIYLDTLSKDAAAEIPADVIKRDIIPTDFGAGSKSIFTLPKKLSGSPFTKENVSIFTDDLIRGTNQSIQQLTPFERQLVLRGANAFTLAGSSLILNPQQKLADTAASLTIGLTYPVGESPKKVNFPAYAGEPRIAEITKDAARLEPARVSVPLQDPFITNPVTDAEGNITNYTREFPKRYPITTEGEQRNIGNTYVPSYESPENKYRETTTPIEPNLEKGFIATTTGSTIHLPIDQAALNYLDLERNLKEGTYKNKGDTIGQDIAKQLSIKKAMDVLKAGIPDEALQFFRDNEQAIRTSLKSNYEATRARSERDATRAKLEFERSGYNLDEVQQNIPSTNPITTGEEAATTILGEVGKYNRGTNQEKAHDIMNNFFKISKQGSLQTPPIIPYGDVMIKKIGDAAYLGAFFIEDFYHRGVKPTTELVLNRLRNTLGDYGKYITDDIAKKIFQEGMNYVRANEADPFFSPMKQSAAEKLPNRFTAQQAQDILEKFVNEYGWTTGLKDFLKENDGKKISKAQLLDVINQGQVEVRARIASEEEAAAKRQKLYAIDSIIDQLQAKLTVSNLSSEEYQDAYIKLEQAKQERNEIEISKVADKPRFSLNNYTQEKLELPGAENSKEVKLISPLNSPNMRLVPEFINYLRDVEGITPQEFYDSAGYKQDDYVRNFRASDTPGLSFKDESIPIENPEREYKSPHWYEKNVVAHYRSTDRTTTDNIPIYFSEEFQSDWNHDIRIARLKALQDIGNSLHFDNKGYEKVKEDGKKLKNWIVDNVNKLKTYKIVYEKTPDRFDIVGNNLSEDGYVIRDENGKIVNPNDYGSYTQTIGFKTREGAEQFIEKASKDILNSVERATGTLRPVLQKLSSWEEAKNAGYKIDWERNAEKGLIDLNLYDPDGRRIRGLASYDYEPVKDGLDAIKEAHEKSGEPLKWTNTSREQRGSGQEPNPFMQHHWKELVFKWFLRDAITAKNPYYGRKFFVKEGSIDNSGIGRPNKPFFDIVDENGNVVAEHKDGYFLDKADAERWIANAKTDQQYKYNGIGWTTAKQQAERYGKVLEGKDFSWKKNSDGTYTFGLKDSRMNYGAQSDYSFLHELANISLERFAELTTKEAAQEVRDQEAKLYDESNLPENIKLFKSEHLPKEYWFVQDSTKIGTNDYNGVLGSGHTKQEALTNYLNNERKGINGQFSLKEAVNLRSGVGTYADYDVAMVNYAKEIGKRFGAKYSQKEIETSDKNNFTHGEEGRKDALEALRNGEQVSGKKYGDTGPAWKDILTEDDLNNFDRFSFTSKNKETIHFLEITPEMRESLEREGFPLYGLGRAQKLVNPEIGIRNTITTQQAFDQHRDNLVQALEAEVKPNFESRLEDRNKDPEYIKYLESLGFTADEIRIKTSPYSELSDVDKQVRKELRQRALRGRLNQVDESLTNLVKDNTESAIKFNNAQRLTSEELAEVADFQRGDPESAMLNVQFAMGGGVLNPLVENVGDLTHRMTERVTQSYAGYDYVKNKVESSIRLLTNDYGFEREMNENIRNNARVNGISESEVRTNVDNALKTYAESHEQVPVKNEVQKLARDAAVDVGNKRFNEALNKLYKLQDYLNEGQEAWKNRVHAREGESPVKGTVFNSGLSPDAFIDQTKLLYKGLTEFADFSKEMIKRFGEAVKPYLQDLWIQTKQLGNKLGESVAKFHQDERGFLNIGSKVGQEVMDARKAYKESKRKIPYFEWYSLWRGVGLAQLSPDFGEIYDIMRSGQRVRNSFESGVLENLQKANELVKVHDPQAIADVIWIGNEEGRTYSNYELAKGDPSTNRPALNPDQIKAYQHIRNAIDTALDIRKETRLFSMRERAERLNNQLQAATPNTPLYENIQEKLLDLDKAMRGIEAHFQELKESGYISTQRQGRIAAYAEDPLYPVGDSRRTLYNHFDTPKEAETWLQNMKDKFQATNMVYYDIKNPAQLEKAAARLTPGQFEDLIDAAGVNPKDPQIEKLRDEVYSRFSTFGYELKRDFTRGYDRDWQFVLESIAHQTENYASSFYSRVAGELALKQLDAINLQQKDYSLYQVAQKYIDHEITGSEGADALGAVRKGVYLFQLGFDINQLYLNAVAQPITQTYSYFSRVEHNGEKLKGTEPEQYFVRAAKMAVQVAKERISGNLGNIPQEFRDIYDRLKAEKVLEPEFNKALLESEAEKTVQSQAGQQGILNLPTRKRLALLYEHWAGVFMRNGEKATRTHVAAEAYLVGKEKFNLEGNELVDFIVRAVDATQSNPSRAEIPLAVRANVIKEGEGLQTRLRLGSKNVGEVRKLLYQFNAFNHMWLENLALNVKADFYRTFEGLKDNSGIRDFGENVVKDLGENKAKSIVRHLAPLVVMGGIKGLPLSGLASTLFTLITDKDVKDEFDKVFGQDSMLEMFALYGISGSAALSQRLTPSVPFIDNPKIGTSLGGTLSETLSASNIPAIATAAQIGRGFSDLVNGQKLRGISEAFPIKPVRTLATASRYSTEGIRTRANRTLVPKDQVTAGNIVGATIGLQPNKVIENYDRQKSKNVRLLRRKLIRAL